MSKNRPLLVEELREFEGSDTVVAYYSKGHHDKALFVDRLERAHNEALPYDKIMPTAESVEHTYWRCVPVDKGEYGMMVYPAEKGRGAFPVTLWDAHRLNVEWHLAQTEANRKAREEGDNG